MKNIVSAAFSLLLLPVIVNAQIYYWNTSQVIPGTENITPGPGTNLSGWNGYGNSSLDYADLSGGLDLTGSDFSSSSMNFSRMSNANLTDSRFVMTNMANADLSNTNLSESNFFDAYMVDSDLSYANLFYTDFMDADLTNADLSYTGQNGTRFSQADLSNAIFDNAVINGAKFENAVNFTSQQLYSTASYISSNLSETIFNNYNISGWDMSEQNLTYAGFFFSNTTDTDFSRADMRKADFDQYMYSAIIDDTILPDGHINGLELGSGQSLPVRDFDGNLAITVDNKMILFSGSDIEFIFEDDTWGSKITLSENLPVILDGSITLAFAPGTDIKSLVGTTFDIFDWNGQLSINDAFNEIISDYIWNTDNLYSTGEVTLVAVPEPAAVLFLLAGLGLVKKRL